MKGASFSSTVTLQHLKLGLQKTIIRVAIATVCVYYSSNVHALLEPVPSVLRLHGLSYGNAEGTCRELASELAGYRLAMQSCRRSRRQAEGVNSLYRVLLGGRCCPARSDG